MFNRRYPSIEDLRVKAKQRMPKFAYEYLAGGANEEINLKKNTADIRATELQPEYIKEFRGAHLATSLFSETYQAPFGIAPVGLQGLLWPNSAQILAKAAFNQRIPFVLSTVSTASIETVGEITEGNFWFQLYYPAEPDVRDDLLSRASSAGCKTLVILADTPTFGLRYKDMKNGLSMPPKFNLRNVFQALSHPTWTLNTLRHGIPKFKTLESYMESEMDLKQLGRFMDKTFDGRLNEERVKTLRDKWSGNLVVKGVVNPKDMEKLLRIGVDGVIVSNHGGRQLDAGASSFSSLQNLVMEFGSKTTIMMDGGIRSGPDMARCLAAGAKHVFLGRAFMYGVAALGPKGGEHTCLLLKTQLKQVMEQLGCEHIHELPNCILTNTK